MTTSFYARLATYATVNQHHDVSLLRRRKRRLGWCSACGNQVELDSWGYVEEHDNEDEGEFCHGSERLPLVKGTFFCSCGEPTYINSYSGSVLPHKAHGSINSCPYGGNRP